MTCKTMSPRLYAYLPAIIFTALATSLGMLFLLVLWPAAPLSVTLDEHNHQLSILESEAGRGDTLHVRISYCKKEYNVQTVRAWLEIDSKLDEIDASWMILPPGCHNSVLTAAPIPATLSAESVGRVARLRVTKYYRIRGQTYLYTLNSGYFLLTH